MNLNIPRVVDNDLDEITVTRAGKEIRGWSYASEAERRTKMLAAREFCEGWYHATERAAAVAVEEYDEAPNGSYDNGATCNGWKMACSRIEDRINEGRPIPRAFDPEPRAGTGK